jgi:nucleotide-binding universal stress UspA family protein
MLRILIAYDGSECSDKALRDLTKAGMPKEAEAVIFTAGDRWIDEANLAESDFTELSLKQAMEIAKRAVKKLQSYFPGWQVCPESVSDSAAWGIIDKIGAWNPDLVVMGSHGRSPVGRFLFGSISHSVLTRAHCNLRISRGRDGEAREIAPRRIMVAYDGSQESETAFDMVLARHWPKGTEIRLITVIDSKVATAFAHPSGPIRFWIKDEDKYPLDWVERMLSHQKRHIQEKGFVAYSEALQGDPRRVILQEAEKWGADSIFVGPRGLTGDTRTIAGSVSTALATHAHCSVEVVHRLWGASTCCEIAMQEHRACMKETGDPT